jgi:uncharacterized membrane protein
MVDHGAMIDSPVFSATLTPHRSLSPRGRRVVIAAVAVLASIPGIVFYAIGAWPVLGFMGLDVLAVWWALSASTRSGQAAEHVMLYRHALEVRRVSPAGTERTERFDPFYVRFEVTRDHEDRITGLELRTRDRSVALGQFLNPADKASFARAFAPALARLRS